MKLLSSSVGIRVLLCLLLIGLLCQNLYGYNGEERGDRESLERIDSTQNRDMGSCNIHVERPEKRRAKLIPTHLKTQFAGSMGLISIGSGWDYGRHNQWETDLLIGFIPKFSTHKFKVTLTLNRIICLGAFLLGRAVSLWSR